MTPVIAVDEVSRTFGDVVALTDVSFTLEPGLTGILGPNGAGKSTLLRLLCGLITPDSGTIRVLGRDPKTDHTVAGDIGLVPQQEDLLGHLTGRAFVRAMAQLQGVPDADAAAVRLLQQVGLDPNIDRPLRTYSKGMRQRVKLAQALVHDPAVLVLDEPLNGMDPRQRAASIELFRWLADQGRTVLVSSHVLAEVERFGSRILLFVQGRLAAEGDFHDIRDLMDDRPRRIAVRSTDPRAIGAALVGEGLADAIEIESDGRLIVDTADPAGFRRALVAAAAATGARVTEVVPLDDDLESVFRYLVSGRSR